MVFVIKNKKYDTEKMELISDKCEQTYPSSFCDLRLKAKDVKLWKSNKGAYVLTYSANYFDCAKLLSEKEVKSLLLRYDWPKYEELFGELEEG